MLYLALFLTIALAFAQTVGFGVNASKLEGRALAVYIVSQTLVLYTLILDAVLLWPS